MEKKLNIWKQSIICRSYGAGVIDLVSGDSFISKKRFRRLISNVFRVPRYFQPMIIQELLDDNIIRFDGRGGNMIVIKKEIYDLVDDKLKEDINGDVNGN